MRTITVGPTRRVFAAMVNALFPRSCPVCQKPIWRKEDNRFCVNCAEDCVRLSSPSCPRCGRQLAKGAQGECQNCTLSPPDFRYFRVAYQYKGKLRKAILEFKMNRAISRAASLAGLLLETEQMGIDWEGYDFVIPVPLHDNRLKWRGYNQCSLLLREIAKVRKIEWTDYGISRIKDTMPQFKLKPKERHDNVKGAFKCNEPSAFNRASVLLVDDITTTGSTLSECAKTLKAAGASVVDAVAIARPVSDYEAGN